MCGRFTLAAPPEDISALFGYGERPNFPARYNIAPTQPIAIICAADETNGDPVFKLARWGLLPAWVKDVKTFPTLINARSEMAAEKPAFRAAMRRRRCLIPADGFYEWQGSASAKGRGKKQPYYITRADHAPFAFAGLWETYSDPQTGAEMDTATILTTDANATLFPIHERMPVVLDPANYAQWLDHAGQGPEMLKPLLVPTAEDFFTAYPVSTRVNAVANDDAGLIEPMAEITTPPAEDLAANEKAEIEEAKAQQLSLF